MLLDFNIYFGNILKLVTSEKIENGVLTTSERIKGPICDPDALPSFSNFDATYSPFNSCGISSFPSFRVNYLVYSVFILVNFIPYPLPIHGFFITIPV